MVEVDIKFMKERLAICSEGHKRLYADWLFDKGHGSIAEFVLEKWDFPMKIGIFEHTVQIAEENPEKRWQLTPTGFVIEIKDKE